MEGHQQWDQDLSLVLELTSRSTFFLEGYLVQPRYRGKTLVLPQSEVPDFVDSLWEALPSLRSERGLGWEMGGGRDGVGSGFGM